MTTEDLNELKRLHEQWITVRNNDFLSSEDLQLKWRLESQMSTHLHDLIAAAEERDRLQARVRELEGALTRILNFPVHSEPVGGAYGMQDIAHAALEKKP